jgi:uncharacterized protein (TIGR04255 family)
MVTAARRALYEPSLRFVLAEVRFPLSSALLDPNSLQQLVSVIGPEFPVVRPFASGGLMINLPGTVVPELSAPNSPQQGYRFMSRDLYTSVSVGALACTVETTVYRSWEAFRSVLHQVLDGLGLQMGAIAGIDRIGIRYWNELRLADSDERVAIDEWQEFVVPEALSAHVLPSRVLSYPVEEAQTVTRLVPGDGREMVVRHGPLRGSTIADGPLKLPSPLRTGPYYLVDIDSSVTTAAPLQAFDIAATLAAADSIHEPVRTVYDAIVRGGELGARQYVERGNS